MKQKVMGNQTANILIVDDTTSNLVILAEMIKSQCGVKEVVIHYIGGVIGSHSGPGTVALFFLGNER